MGFHHRKEPAQGHVEDVRQDYRMIVIRPDHDMFAVLRAYAEYHGVSFNAAVLMILEQAMGRRK